MRHRTTVFSLLACCVAGGCYASHERGPDVDAGPFDASSRADSGLVLDSGRVDAGSAGGDGGACATSAGEVDVRVEPVTAQPMRCAPTHAEGASLLGTEAAPADRGIRVHMDYCPSADADCRCDIVVTEVGTELAARVRPEAGLTVDVGPRFVSIQRIPSCECLGCPCSLPLVLHAATDDPVSAPFLPPDLELSQGDVVCPAPAACVSGTWSLRAAAFGSVVQVPEGTQVSLGAISVRSVHDVYVFAPCAACAECDTPRASWAAWVSLDTTGG